MRPISCSLLPRFLFSNNPVNDLLVIKKDIPTAMVVVNSPAVKIGIVGDFQPQQFADLFLSQSQLHISHIQVVVGISCLLRAILLIVLRHKNVDSHPLFGHRRIAAIPLGSAMKIGGV